MLRFLLLCVILLFAGWVGWKFFASHAARPMLVGPADRIVVEKAQRRLTLYRDGIALTSYRIALGRAPIGPKQAEGDNRTPEGFYLIDRRKADSDYHRALHISYPNETDRVHAAARGVSAGGDIMIHGQRNGFGALAAITQKRDWTAGCIAVTDAEIEEIWRLVPDGTPIEIRP